MMIDHFFHLFRRFMLFALALAFQLGAEPHITVDPSSIRLTGHVPSRGVSEAVFLKQLDSDAHIPLTFVLPLQNREELEALVQRIHDPADQQHYGKYLTPQKFAERFAPSPEDYGRVAAYATSLGLTVTKIHSNRILLNVTGTAKSIERAFNLRLHQHQKHNGRTFYAPDNDPEVSRSIADVIHCIVGLDNHALWHTYNRQKPAMQEFLTSNAGSHGHPSGPAGGYSPDDLLTAYNLTPVSANGSGEIIALFELGGYLTSDINTYANYFGLNPPKLKNILVDGGSNTGIDPEVTLDIELALALAPKSQIYVYEGPNSDQGVLDTYNRIATDNLARQVSTSWGIGENLVSAQYLQAENAIFLQMAAQGQTIYAAAGDSGAYDDHPSSALDVDDPASQPYVIGVGGTKLTVNPVTGAYTNESVWNEGRKNGAGGGGVSRFWPLPSWQKNVSTVYSKTHRNVPDVSLNADPATGYSVYYNGEWTVFGGTSCAAPLWAAFTARINQERTATQKPALGFANPLLYTLGIRSSNTANYHDVTMGDNLYYSAGKGYDNASGWGSFNGAKLFASLTNPSSMPVLNITMNHTAPFTKGGTGVYKILVSNQGNGSTPSPLTVAITLPKGIRFKSFRGTGWTFDETTLTCSYSGMVEAGSSFPLIVVTVDVDQNPPKSVTPTATVSGGGSAPVTVRNLTTFR